MTKEQAERIAELLDKINQKLVDIEVKLKFIEHDTDSIEYHTRTTK